MCTGCVYDVSVTLAPVTFVSALIFLYFRKFDRKNRTSSSCVGGKRAKKIGCRLRRVYMWKRIVRLFFMVVDVSAKQRRKKTRLGDGGGEKIKKAHERLTAAG